MARIRDRRVPDSSSQVDDFRGLVTNADPKDLPPGASPDQVNCVSARVGELKVRNGTRVITFED